MASGISTSELNMRCAGVKRLLKEASELRNPNELLYAKPMEDNLFEWHFTIRGPPDTVYENGVYHGRIILPVEYPMKPPSLMLLTPNGRFETNKKVCLSISGYHPETWLPSWSIRTALLALIGFMPSHPKGALGGLECSDIERRRLAIKSLNWRCEMCNCSMREILPLMTDSTTDDTRTSHINAIPTTSQKDPLPHNDATGDSLASNIITSAKNENTANVTVLPAAQNSTGVKTGSGSVVILPSNGRSWQLLLYIFLFSAAFGALLLRRLSKV